jgi:hypothetical protein
VVRPETIIKIQHFVHMYMSCRRTGTGSSRAGSRSFSRDGRLRCHRLESPSDPPPQNYGTWCPGGVRPTPPELRNMKPGISGITAGIRWTKEIHVKWCPGGVRPTPPELRNMVPRGGPTHPPGIAERWHRNLPSLAKERNPASASTCARPPPSTSIAQNQPKLERKIEQLE